MGNYDYSGGGLGGPNRHMAEAIKKIRAGQTRGQQDRALLDKVMVTGLGAGLGAIGHTMEAAKSAELRDNQRKANTMRNAIDSQSRLAGEQAAIRKSSEQYASPDYDANASTSMGHSADVPSWLNESQGNPYEDIQGAAETAKANQQTNAAAAGAMIGGYHTPEGAERTSADANAQFRDMGTSQDMMKMGGMMNSLPRVPR